MLRFNPPPPINTIFLPSEDISLGNSIERSLELIRTLKEDTRSPGQYSDLFILVLNGSIVAKIEEGALAVISPQSPSYHHGNFLLMSHPPELGDFQRWEALFGKVFGEIGEKSHRSFTWIPTDTIPDLTEFQAGGYQVDVSGYMELSKSASLKTYNTLGSHVFTIAQPQEQKEWTDLTAASTEIHRELFPSHQGTPEFVQARVDEYRSLMDAGQGEWYTAHVDGELAGAIALFWDPEQEIVTFQDAFTVKNFRGQGVCTKLVESVCHDLRQRFPTARFILEADAGSIAERVYKKIGFEPLQSSITLTKVISWAE